MGRRNTRLQSTGWSLEPQSFSWTLIYQQAPTGWRNNPTMGLRVILCVSEPRVQLSILFRLRFLCGLLLCSNFHAAVVAVRQVIDVLQKNFRLRAVRGAGAGERAAGARRLRHSRGKSELGYKSLGAAIGEREQGAALPRRGLPYGYGWVPVDPADVRKVVLEEPPGNRPLDDEMVARARKRLFGSWEMNWIAYNFAHDVALPGSTGRRCTFLMYPQAETAEDGDSSIPTASRMRSPRGKSQWEATERKDDIRDAA